MELQKFADSFSSTARFVSVGKYVGGYGDTNTFSANNGPMAHIAGEMYIILDTPNESTDSSP